LILSGAGVACWWRNGAPNNSRVVVDQDQGPLLLSKPVKLATGIYLLGETQPSAVYVIETTDGLVLVDSGPKPDAVAVTRQMMRLGLDPTRVRAVLLTHAHADHSFGAMYFRRAFGARIYAGSGDSRVLRSGSPSEALFCNFPPTAGSKIHHTAVDVELSGGEVIERGDARIRALATPGHTLGSMCYLLERDDLRALFTGDVVLSLSSDLGPATAIGVQSPLGTYTTYLAPRYRGSARDYLSSLRMLRELPAPDLLLPGHPRHDRTPQSARVTPQHWREILDLGIGEMERLLARYENDGASFLDGIPKELLTGLYYLGDRNGLAVYCLHAPDGLFLFDAPGGAGLLEFVESRLHQLGVTSVHPTAVLLTSCGPETTSGLKDLVARTGCQVIAPGAGLELVKKACPPETVVHSEVALRSAAWFSVQPVPLRGRGLAPMAYLINWKGKTVLVSGRIPVKVNPIALPDLVSSLAAPGGDNDEYIDSLRQLSQFQPDLWLPLAPIHGQNANLYGNEWQDRLQENVIALMGL